MDALRDIRISTGYNVMFAQWCIYQKSKMVAIWPWFCVGWSWKFSEFFLQQWSKTLQSFL